MRRDVGYRNGRLASTLPSILSDHGLVNISVEAFPLVRDPDDAFGLPHWVRLGPDRGHGFTDDDVSVREAAIAAARHVGCVYALLYFVVAGTKRTG